MKIFNKYKKKTSSATSDFLSEQQHTTGHFILSHNTELKVATKKKTRCKINYI